MANYAIPSFVLGSSVCGHCGYIIGWESLCCDYCLVSVGWEAALLEAVADLEEQHLEVEITDDDGR